MHNPPDNKYDLRRGPRLAFVVFSTIVMGTAFACSSRSLATFGSGESDAGGGLSFETPVDAEADASSPGSSTPPVVNLCASTECPAPFASCSAFGLIPTYQCASNTSNDPGNCGACGHECLSGAAAFHLVPACVDGQCHPFCQSGWSDCNTDANDGCESDPNTDSNNCGLCGNKCADGVACIAGQCGCAPGQTICNGECVDLKEDDANCGACGTSCDDHQPEDAGTHPNMHYACNQGTCSALSCKRFFADCNDNLELDGCEVDLGQPDNDHCGQCANACTPDQECFSTPETGMACQCQGPKTLCPGPSCADLESDPRNCGSCGYICPTVDGADIACVHGHCSFTCQPGQADCNGRANDGCEVDLSKDPRSCGACGTSCDVGIGQPCVGGQCVTEECDAGGQIH